jgi:hypothetical protein
MERRAMRASAAEDVYLNARCAKEKDRNVIDNGCSIEAIEEGRRLLIQTYSQAAFAIQMWRLPAITLNE